MNEPSEIKKPVFILGPERSGTTLLYSMLANAHEFYWFSRIDSLLPSKPLLAEMTRRLFGLIEKGPYVAHPGKISSIKGINTPSECNAYWKKFFGWGNEQNYLVGDDRFLENDLSDRKKKFINNDFKKRLTYSGKKRMLLKQPGFSLKLRFWNHVFPDAFYLICTRNIEDNVCSLIKAKRESDEYFWGTKVDGWRDYMNADYRTQALLQLKQIYSGLAEDLKFENIARKTMVVSYDQLLSEPEEEIRKAARFCQVKWNKQMESALKGIIRQEPLNSLNTDFSLPSLSVIEEFRGRADELFASNQSLKPTGIAG